MTSYNTQRSNLCVDQTHSPYATPMSLSKYGTIPYEKLGCAIRWEEVRSQYFEMVGRHEEAHESRLRARGYKRRSVKEAEQVVTCTTSPSAFS